jgi:hypothetical protein
MLQGGAIVSRRLLAQLLFASLLISFIIWAPGCGGDSGTESTPPAKSTVIVSRAPYILDCTWTLDGPGSYSYNGQGADTLSGLNHGDYTITWNDMTGWTKPSPATESKTVAAGETITFTGKYILVPGTVALRLTNTDAATTGYVRVADDPGLEPQVFTVEAWITPKGAGYGQVNDAGGAVLIGKMREGVGGSWLASWTLQWTLVGESVRFGVVNQLMVAGHKIDTPDGAAPLDSTTHVACVFDGSMLSIYIDGTLEASETYPYSGVDYGDQDVLIGAANFTSGYLRRYDGIIDEVRLWDHARTEGQINAGMFCRLVGNEPGLLAYWSFEDNDLTDGSGNGHDGTLEEVGSAVSYVDPEVSLPGCP